MTATGFALFDTAIGTCAIAWDDGPILVGASLPERDAGRIAERMGRRYPEAVESPVPVRLTAVVSDIVDLMAGGTPDFADAPLDMASVGDFEAKVYAIARAIPPGETLTYGDVARQLGDVSLSRAVGQALGRNPWPPIVPCHRVLASNGKTGGFSAPGGIDTKFRMLEIERRHAPTGGDLFAASGGLAFGVKRTG